MRMDIIMCSIDGPQFTTDKNRGHGTYERIINNINWLRAVGYTGDIVARMTVSSVGNVYESVTHLLSKGLFDHVHWQVFFKIFFYRWMYYGIVIWMLDMVILKNGEMKIIILVLYKIIFRYYETNKFIFRKL